MLIRNIINRYRKNKKKGFTLVEMAVNLAIVGIITIMVTTLTNTTLLNFNGQKNKMDAIGVANLVSSSIENRIRMASGLKLENEFVEKNNGLTGALKKVNDQTGDQVPDESCFRDSAVGNDKTFEYPICLAEAQQYTTIFQLPIDKTLLKVSQRTAASLAPSKRAGRLYYIDKTPDAKHGIRTVGATDINALINPQGEYLKIYPLIPDDYYRGYNVDVHYQYISVSTENSGIDVSGDTENTHTSTDKVTVGKQSCIKVLIDVYDGDKVVYQKASTVTFMQIQFSMDKPRTTWANAADEATVMKELKTMLFYR